MKKRWRALLALLLALAMVFTLASCDDDWEDYEGTADRTTQSGDTTQGDQSSDLSTGSTSRATDTGTDWVFYWYLCGSDLESNYGSATDDLFEMMDVQLPEGVTVVIQTGGAYEWMNNFVSADTLQRYVYDSDGLYLVEEVPSASMGEAAVLADFLSFATENYPGDRTMFTFWNHGGGSVTGAAFDELYDFDSLDLNEMYEAFCSVYTPDMDNPPIDIIGFDTCLMATLDTAYAFCDLASYLVASEEVEPGNGWSYDGFLSTMANNTTISPLDLAINICDTYAEGCAYYGTDDSITLSVTDLSQTLNVLEAYDAFYTEGLSAALENPSFFAHFSQSATMAENYGGNTKQQGYTDMVDLGELAKLSADLMPETYAQLVSAVENAVVYQITSQYRPYGYGLAGYYPYSGYVDDFYTYSAVCPSWPALYFHNYALTGELLDGTWEYLTETSETEVEIVETQPLTTLNNTNWEDIALTIDRDGCAVLDLGPEAYDVLSSVTFELYYILPEEDLMVFLGEDNDIISDWDRGVFTENFRGVWGSIDGCLCFMELSYEGDGYNEYIVPVLLNGEEYNLSVVYDFDIEAFIILGARKPQNDAGAADKYMVHIYEGDVIEPLLYYTYISNPADVLEPFVLDSLTVTQDTTFTEEWLGDGLYMMSFCMTDYQGNLSTSQVVSFDVYGDEIITSVD